MKKYSLYFLLFALALGSCKKDKTEPFMKDPDERLSVKLSEYQNQLTGAEFGWKAYLLTGSEKEGLIKTATLIFSFKENKVTMSADYIKEKGQEKESSYRLKGLQRPTIIFDTYSMLHKITDPTPIVFEGSAGDGHYADFEFAFLSATADTIKLEGTFYKNKLYLIRSKSAADNLTAIAVKDNLNNNILFKQKTYFRRVTINGVNCELYMDPIINYIRFKYLDETGVQKMVSANYYVSEDSSLNFFDPVTIGNKTLTRIKDLSLDASSNFIKATTNYGDPFQIEEATSPLYYDETIAAHFIANPIHGSRSISRTGFRVDGVIDGYGVKKIPDFVATIYVHKYPNQAYGGFRFLIAPNGILGVASYGPALTPTIKEGKVFYTIPGYFSRTYPTVEILAIVRNIANTFEIKEGFYVIQISINKYELVAANDARKWIIYE